MGAEAWVVVAAVTTAAVIVVLHAFAAKIRDAVQLHDLRRRVAELRRDAEAEAAARKAAEADTEVLVVDEAPIPAMRAA